MTKPKDKRECCKGLCHCGNDTLGHFKGVPNCQPKTSKEVYGIDQAIKDICSVSVAPAAKSRVRQILNVLLLAQRKEVVEKWDRHREQLPQGNTYNILLFKGDKEQLKLSDEMEKKIIEALSKADCHSDSQMARDIIRSFK